MRLLIFGFGFSGRALADRLGRDWTIAGTSRSPEGRAALAKLGVEPVDPADGDQLMRVAAEADALLVAAPPEADGCAGLRALRPVLGGAAKSIRWIGYLSTTGVYGDHGGRWVTENTPLSPQSPEGERRAAAEEGWLTTGRELGRPVAVFRLPGIYGPGRSALDRLRAGQAQRIMKPGHVFSRIHVEDLAAGIEAELAAERGGVYNLCDDEPAPASDVTAYAAKLLGMAAPPEQPFTPETLSVAARRFWSESKRVSNARAKAVLGWRPAYPSYRVGLAAILRAENGLSTAPPPSRSIA